MSARPNSDPTMFFPLVWAREVPTLWEWAKKNALHYEQSVARMGWNVWFPLAEPPVNTSDAG